MHKQRALTPVPKCVQKPLITAVHRMAWACALCTCFNKDRRENAEQNAGKWLSPLPAKRPAASETAATLPLAARRRKKTSNGSAPPAATRPSSPPALKTTGETAKYHEVPSSFRLDATQFTDQMLQRAVEMIRAKGKHIITCCVRYDVPALLIIFPAASFQARTGPASVVIAQLPLPIH